MSILKFIVNCFASGIMTILQIMGAIGAIVCLILLLITCLIGPLYLSAVSNNPLFLLLYLISLAIIGFFIKSE